MESLIEVLLEIRNGIYAMNANIEELKNSVEELKGNGLYNSITDVCDKLDSMSEDIVGNGLFNSLSDVYNKLDEISSTLDSIDANTM
ncbi:hypothetical protein NYE48_22885 [Paenibacillus sp. FSL M7-1455]|uniref:hypothetical protein n=1 Tax=Paenibacillus sp. FSL M7-1455 TaxID=2975316 RepID=UPI0030F8E9F8